MTIVRRIVGEPLVHFVVAGAILFGAYSALNRVSPQQDRRVIDVGKGQLAQLFETFSRTWQRPPTEAELSGLIDGYVKEEVFYREGQAMGLDQDDAIFRRRMQQKLEFLLEPTAEELKPGNGELQAYFTKHAGRYEQPVKMSFRQLFFASKQAGDVGETAAKAALLTLNTPSLDHADTNGDATMLPSGMEVTDVDAVASVFGEAFVAETVSGPVGQWFGPVRSSYGVHLVYVESKEHPVTPSLAEVEGRVRLDWENDRRREIADKRYAEMKSRYDITVSWHATDRANVVNTSGVRK